MAFEFGAPAQEPLDDNDAQSIASDLSKDALDGRFKEELLDAITDIQSVGTFASSVPIALPLGESQARQIIAQAHQAPYGKGNDTLVDTAVRNTWELDPSQFNIGSPDWTWLIQHLCPHVAASLGINTAVHAEIYKMLVYEKGAMFKAHTDTEKIPGMFGTLVISLPLNHLGGDVILKHCGETITYSSSQYDMSCASWYSDVSHEVLPVTSGYRWILAFNLAIDQSLPPPSAGYSPLQMHPIRRCLDQWLALDKKFRQNKYVYHVLDYEYTEANVSFRSLKGDDLARITALQEACDGLPVSLFLALLEKKEFGSVYMDPWLKGKKRKWYEDEIDYGEDPDAYHELEDIFEVSYKPKIIRDMAGMPVTDTLGLRGDDLLDEECFDDIEAEEDYEGFMGNSGPTATHWYRVGAIAIVPHDSIVDYLGNCSESYYYSTTPLRFQINWLADQCMVDDAPEHLVTAMKQLFNRALSESRSSRDMWKSMADTTIVPRVIKAALQQHQYQFFETAMSSFYHNLTPDLFEWVRDWIIKEENEDDKRLERFEKIKTALQPAVSPSGSFNRQFQVIKNLAPLPKDLGPDLTPVPEPMLEWARSSLRNILEGEGPTDVGQSDGPALVDQALYFENPMLVLTQSVVPIFEKQLAAPAFRLSLLNRLKELDKIGTLPKEDVKNLYRTLVRILISSQDFASIRDRRHVEALENKRQRQTRPYETFISTPDAFKNAVDRKALLLFFTSILEESTELDNLTTQFVAKVTSQADKLSHLERTIWLSLLAPMIQKLEAKHIPLDTPVYREFFSAIITSVIDGYIGTKPAGTANYSIAGVYCSCGDCTALNAFLDDPSLKSQGFPLSKSRRHHMHQSLDGAGVRCTHQTVRTTRPETLVVTKQTQQEEVELQRWVVRKDTVLGDLNQIQTDHLRTFLGAGYEKVDLLRRGQTVQVNLASRPVVGDKRRISQTEVAVIDLTSD